MAKFGEMNALAAAGSGYQALVCVFLLGGNDGHNTVIPITTAQQNYSLYQQDRGGLAIPQGVAAADRQRKRHLRPASQPGGDSGSLQPGQGRRAGQRRHAGSADHARGSISPTTARLIPSALFSHSDQSSQWQTGIPSGIGSSGWGGRITDLLQSQNSGAIFPPMTATNSCQLFCTGRADLSGHGSAQPGIGAPWNRDSRAAQIARNAGMQQLLTFDNGVQLVQAAQRHHDARQQLRQHADRPAGERHAADAVPRGQSAGGAVADRGATSCRCAINSG